MIGLLARRTLTDRPRRTLLLLGGFGLSVGVMIVLLSIGQAVLEQARDKDVIGGGDVIVLPEGVDIEVMKVGGATGMFFSIDNARFVYRQVLSGPRFAGWIESLPGPASTVAPGPAPAASPPLAAASPELANEVVYVRRPAGGSAPRRALAHGVLPSLQRVVNGGPVSPEGAPIDWTDTHADRMWIDPPVDSLYNDMDRFHRPPPGTRDLDRWAEWLYFNFSDPESGAHGFLSFIVGGDPTTGAARGYPLLQLVRPGEPPARFAGDLALGPDGFSTERVDLRFGDGTRARFESGAWRLALDWQSAAGRVRGALDVAPVPDLYYPPFWIHSSADFASGYAVPALGATIDGWIEAGGRRLELQRAPGYHDHNWGTWRNVHWDWGTAASPEYGLFYGRVEHPELQPGRAGAGIFLMLLQARQGNRRGGFLALFRPDSIAYSWRVAPSSLPGQPARVPEEIRLTAALDPYGLERGAGGDTARGGHANPDRIDVRIRVQDVLSNPPGEREAGRVFLQLRGSYGVSAVVTGRELAFAAPGFAEVFVPSRVPGTSSADGSSDRGP